MRSENRKITLFLLGAFLFAIYCFVFGQSGILERSRLEKEKESLATEIRNLEKENRRLERIYADYSSDKMKVSECEKAGYVFPGEKVLFFSERKRTSDRKKYFNIENSLDIETLRILWISISVVIIGVYCGLVFFRKRNEAVTVSVGEDE